MDMEQGNGFSYARISFRWLVMIAVCEFGCVHVVFLDANWSVCRAEA